MHDHCREQCERQRIQHLLYHNGILGGFHPRDHPSDPKQGNGNEINERHIKINIYKADLISICINPEAPPKSDVQDHRKIT